MRKILATMTFMAFICNGCAWLGMGDDESSTVQAEPATEESVISVTDNSQPAPAKTKAAKTTKKGAKKSEAQIKQELDKKGQQLVAQSARTLLPNKAHKEVKKVGNEWVASYVNVDTNHVSTELRQGANGQYVGFIRYEEEFMECRGATKQAALSAPCQRVRARRMNELIRYDGNQWLD